MSVTTRVGEIISVLPACGIQLRIVPPNLISVPDDPDLLKAAELYAKVFSDWPGAYNYILHNYQDASQRVLTFLEVEGEAVGCLITVYGRKEAIVPHLIECVATSAHRSAAEFEALHEQVQQSLNRRQIVEIAEVFIEGREAIRDHLKGRRQALLADLKRKTTLSRSYSAAGMETHAYVHKLISSFQSAQSPHSRRLIHNTYRMCSLSFLLSGLVYSRRLLKAEAPICLQWTNEGLGMYKIFKTLCDYRHRRRMIAFLVTRLAYRIQSLNNIMRLIQQSSIIWEGQIEVVDDPQPYRVLISQMPLNELCAMISQWDSYRFFIRMQPTAPLVNAIRQALSRKKV